MQTKVCVRCKQELPLGSFSERVVKTAFKTQKQTHHVYCRDCNAARSREWRKQNRAYRPSGKVTAFPQEDRRLVSAIRQRIVDARTRCKKLKRNPPDVSIEHLYALFKRQGGRCAISGVELSFEIDHPHGISLDQIDPGKGYVENNVQWLSWFVNRAKGEMLNDVFVSMCEQILEYQKVQRLSNGSNKLNLVE